MRSCSDFKRAARSGFDFETAFLGELKDASGALGAEAPVGNVDGLVSRPDGNNVSMDREGMQMAKEQLQFRFGVEVLKDQYSNVMSAIHAEDK